MLGTQVVCLVTSWYHLAQLRRASVVVLKPAVMGALVYLTKLYLMFLQEKGYIIIPEQLIIQSVSEYNKGLIRVNYNGCCGVLRKSILETTVFIPPDAGSAGC